ncbi:hypothetical protein E2C01_077894 [Portunus trituberculatus]|uniref:Uncharacterized protein n=1 Tax=Portunus trituberculatus TaxID=210409 RepID=A0A5B7ICJ9_PORTR|nr:hypothetical protein [Portunus trituberculatus]
MGPSGSAVMKNLIACFFHDPSDGFFQYLGHFHQEFPDCTNKSIHSGKLAAVRALLGISPPAGDAEGRLVAMVNTGHKRGRCCHNISELDCHANFIFLETV